MEKAKIDSLQFFSMIYLFNMGTALVVSLALQAGKDAWIAILIGTLGGLGLFAAYLYPFRLYPDIPLTGYLSRILGKYLGWVMSLLYILFFIYGASRDVRDGGSLLAASILDDTPLLAIQGMMVLSIAYVLYLGIEVLARTALMFFAVLLVTAILGNMLLVISGVIDLKNLLPILGDGWKPVFLTVYKQSLTFPFGEMICFAMIMPYLNRPKQGGQAGLLAVLLSGLSLSYAISVDIATLGVEITGRASFPLLTAISKVNIGTFIQRVDILAVISLIVSVFFKVAVFYYAAIIGAAELFKVQDYRKLVYPTGLIILASSLMISGNFPGHLVEGNFALQTVFMFFGVIFPIVLVLAATIRKKIRSSKT